VWDLKTPPEHIKARTIAVEIGSHMGRTPPAPSPGP
jgi:hypothetical protein